MKKVAFHNLGCKVNSYEMEYMQQSFEEMGYEIVPFTQKADIYVVNTCTVTNIADRKSRQMLHRAKKNNPAALVVAAGCYAETDPQGVRNDPMIDLAISNKQKKDIVRIVESHLTGTETEPSCFADTEMSLKKTMEHTRVSIKVQDGCDQFCSYCIIPYARGRISSRLKDSVLSEIEALAAAGYQEVVLTGIHLSSYGLDLGADPVHYNGVAKTGDYTNEKLMELIEETGKIPGIERVRLGSLEPRIITEAFLEGMQKVDAFCDHFHLSLQSGSDSVLLRMNRHYTTDEYLQKVRLIRRYFPSAAITTDVIVGFPGETEAEFEETRAFLSEVDFYDLHVFKYSRRKGTVADRMEHQIEEGVKEERSRILIREGMVRKEAFLRERTGSETEVLLEEEEQIGGRTYLIGFTRNYIRCAVENPTCAKGVVKGTVKGLLTDEILEVLAEK